MAQNKNIELTKVSGSYVNQLIKYKIDITNKYADTTISVFALKDFVREIVINTNDKALTDKSPATKRFLERLAKQTTKDKVITLVWNAIMAGDGLQVLK